MKVQSSSNRLQELDALRGIAALMVVFYHYTSRFSEIYGSHLNDVWKFEIGKYGVLLFFMISGFVIFMTLGRTKTGADFVVARAARLFPAYWAGVVLTSLVVHAFGLPGREYPWWVSLLNLTMIHSWLATPHVDGVYWTLSLELAFYGWIWLALVTGRAQQIWNGCFCGLLVVLALGLAEQRSEFRLYWPFRPVFLLGSAHLFIAGMAFFRLYSVGWRHAPSAWLLIAMSLGTELVFGTPESFLVLLFCILLFSALMMGWLRLLVWQPLLYLGSISYSLYLLHQNIGYVVIRALLDASIHEPLILIGVPVALSLVLAHLVRTYVEVPLGRQMRDWWQVRRAAE